MEYYISHWNLSNLQKITETPTSHIYTSTHNNKKCILKVYTEHGKKCESTAIDFLKIQDQNAVVSVLNANSDAILLNYLPGPSLKSLVLDGKDNEVTKIISGILNRIHKIEIPKNHKFELLERRYRSLMNPLGDIPPIIGRAQKFASHLLANQSDVCLLHGDIHHENIIQDEKGAWIAIDPQPLIGPRAYDCVNALHNPHKMPQLTENTSRLLQQTDTLSQIMGIDRQSIINYAFVYGCLSACWSMEDDGESYADSPALRTSAMLEPYVRI